MLKLIATRYLDVSIVHVKEQNQTDMETLQAKMDGFFSIITTHYVKGVFENSIRQFLKEKGFTSKIYSLNKDNEFAHWV
jgi:hypothetical protein